MRRLPFLFLLWLILEASGAGAGEVTPPKIDLTRLVGQGTTLEGKVSQEPWQHLVGSFEGKEAFYFDLLDGSQIVVYAPKDFDCLERCTVTGKVVAITGGGKGHKSEEVFTEHHLVVDSFRCLGSPEVETRLDLLADPAVPREAKDKTEHEVVKLGKAAIPTLIQHLKDARVCWREPKQGKAEEAVTIGQRSDWLLRLIITPAYQSPHASNVKPAGGGAYPFRVPDWRAWWDRHHFRSLDSIHRDMHKVIDAYWQSNGTEQVVK
jgi:hypothetical protein